MRYVLSVLCSLLISVSALGSSDEVRCVDMSDGQSGVSFYSNGVVRIVKNGLVYTYSYCEQVNPSVGSDYMGLKSIAHTTRCNFVEIEQDRILPDGSAAYYNGPHGFSGYNGAFVDIHLARGTQGTVTILAPKLQIALKMQARCAQ